MPDDYSDEEYPWKDALGDYALVPVHPKDKRTLTNMFLVYTGVLACIAALWGGGTLGAELDVNGLLIAAFTGSAIVAVIGGLTAYIGGTTGNSTYVNLSRPFGRFGGFIWGLPVAGITCGIGWFAVETWLFGIMIHDLAPHAWWANVGVASIWGGLLMMTTAVVGYSGLAFLSYLTVPMFLIIAGVAAVMGVYAGGGLSHIITKVPAHPIPLTVAITSVVGLYIAGAVITSDVGRFGKCGRDTVIAWVTQVMIIMPYFLVGAGLLTLAMGGTRITKALLLAGAGLGAYALTIFGQWTTNDNNLYSGALNFSLLVPLPKRVITVILGCVGTAIAAYVGFVAGASLQPFINFLIILGKFVPAVGGVLIADYYIYHAYKKVPLKERYKLKIGEELPEINWVGWVSAIVGGVVGGWVIHAGIAALNSLLLAIAIYAILSIICDKAGIPMHIGKYKVTEFGLAPKWIVERYLKGGEKVAKH